MIQNSNKHNIMPDKKYLIEIPDMPDGSGVWDADKWERNKDKFMQKYPTANVFELGSYDPEDMDDNDQFMLTFDDDPDASGVWDAAKWERNKDKFLAKYPEARVNRVRYMDYWGDKAKSDQARIAELQQPDEERNARLAEMGYYDDSAGTRVDYANALGLSPLSSAVKTNSVSGEVTYLDPRVEEFFADDSAYTDRQMELNRLRDEYEANPRVIEQREYEAQMARYAEELEKQIKADMEADVDAYQAGRGAAAKHMQDASGANQTIQAIRMLKGEDVGKDVTENEKQERYASALKLLQQAKDARDVAGKGMAGGVADTAKDWLRNLGTQSDIEMYNEVGNILTALEQKVGNLNEVSDEVIEENLTNDEKALIRAFFEYNAAMADAGEDMSIWYKGGKIFAESIPFMMEFLVTGGLANSAGRAATSWMGKGFAKWIANSAKGTAARAAKKAVAKTVSGVAKTVVAAGARTLVAPTTYKNIAEQSVQYGEDGHLDRDGNMVKAAVDSYIEQLSEMSGAAFGKVLGGVGRLALGKTAFEQVGAWFGNNAVMQNLSKLGFHGLPEEVGEEIFGNALRTITGVDEEALSRMFEKDEFASMIIGFAPMTLLGAGMSMAKMGAVSIGAANAGRRMRQDLSRSYTEEQIDQVEMALDEAKDANEIANAIRPIIVGMKAAGAPMHEIQSVWDYAIAVAKKKAMVSAQSTQEMQLAQAKIGEAQERMGGRFWIENKDGVKSVKQVVLNNGNTAYVVSEPDQDGRVAIINAVTGQKGTALPGDIKEESWNGTLNAFGTGLVMADRTQREQQRMQEERTAQVNEVRNRLGADPRINIGTEGSPIYVVAQSFNDAGVRYVAQDGSVGDMSWEQAADSIGMPIVVKTDAQIAQEEAEALVAAAAERRAKRAKRDAVGATERDNAVVDAENAVEGANEAAKHIPMNDDGTVNEAAFWEQSPEEYVKWNDEQNQDGGQDSLQQVAIAKQELMGLLQEANAAQNTSNPTTRKAAKKEVERLADRIARLDAIEQSYAQALEEEQAVAEEATREPQTEEERREPLRQRAKELADKLGVKVNIAESLSDVKEEQAREQILRIDVSGSKERATGWYNPSSGEVTIYLPHTTDAKEIERTIVHEVVAHKGLRGLLGTEGFNVLCDSVWDMMSEEDRRKFMAYPGVNGNKRAAADEYIAHYAETLNLEESKPVWDRIMDLIMRILNSMGVNIQMTKEQLSDIIVASYQKLINDAQFASAEEASDTELSSISEERLNAPNSGEASQITAADGEVIADTDGNGKVRFSIRTWLEGGRDYLAAWLAKDTTLADDEKADILARMDEFYQNASLYSDTYVPFGTWSEAGVRYDGNGNPLMSVIKANGDYAMNLDFSLVCKKRRPLNRLLRTLVNRNAFSSYTLRERELAEINWILQEHGFEVACALCFVDSKRYRVTGVADVFASLYNSLVKSIAPKGVKIGHFNYSNNPNVEKVEDGLDTLPDEQLNWAGLDKALKGKKEGSVEYKVAQYLREHPEARRLVDATDFIEAEGFESVKENNPDLLKFYNMKKGTGGPKASFGDVQYLNDILKNERAFSPEKAYAVGGVRLQSFSDFVPHMYFDYMQLFAELAAKKLPVHAYTKEVLFAKIFGLTGAKINLSLVPAVVEGGVAPGLDAEGNYAWADPIRDTEDNIIQQGQTFPFDEAMAIQNAEGYSKNCGAIAVGISDAHIEKMLDDPNIQFIIPYHKSSLNAIVARMTNIDKYKDYTNVQNTRKATGSKLDKGTKDFNFNEHLHNLGESGTPQQAAQAYLDWCRENGFVPKFSQFAYNPNYYKLLVDFNTIDTATGEYAPQGAVSMTFPTEQSAFGNVETLIQQGLQEDAELEERLEAEINSIADQVLARLAEIAKEPKMTEKQQARKMAEIADERMARIRERASGTIDILEEARRVVEREDGVAFRVISDENYEMAQRIINNLAGRPYFQRVEGEYELGKLASNYAELADIIMAIDANGNYTPVGTALLGFFAENPDMHFPLLFNNSAVGKETSKAFAEELSKVNDPFALYFMKEAWKIHKGFLELAGLGVKPSSTTKYNKAIDARAEEIKAAEVNGTAFNFKKQESSLDEIDAIFKQLNKDEDLALLHDRVMNVARTLGVKVSFAGKRGNTAGESLGDKVSYDYKFFNSPAVSNQKKCNTITHELIHSVTVYAIYLRSKAPSVLSDGMLEAVDILHDVYNQIARDPAFKGEYGVTDVYEMVAELSNAQFRDKLKEKNLFQRILDALKRLLGIDTVKEDSAYQVLSDTLNYIIDNYDQAAFDAYALYASKSKSYGRMMIQEESLVPGHIKGQSMLSDAEMMSDAVSFRITRNTMATIESWCDKAGLDAGSKEGFISYLDTQFEDTTEQLCAAKWYLAGKINLPGEDDYKVRSAVKAAKKNKVDALAYESPMDILERFRPKEKLKPINPDTVPTLKNKTAVPGTDINIYDVEESEESRKNMREIINTHYGKNASPWCLLQGDENGDLTKESAEYWENYSAYPKQVAFKNGRLLAFSANSIWKRVWWDRMDRPHEGVPVAKSLNDAGNRKCTSIIDPKTGKEKGVTNIFRNESKDGYTIRKNWDGIDGPIVSVQKLKDDKVIAQYDRYTRDDFDNAVQYFLVGRPDGIDVVYTPEKTMSFHYNGDLEYYATEQLRVDHFRRGSKAWSITSMPDFNQYWFNRKGELVEYYDKEVHISDKKELSKVEVPSEYLDLIGRTRQSFMEEAEQLLVESGLIESQDIRFRVRTEEEREKLFADAKGKYGVTDNFNAAGYMLPDGSLLDFSEANDGGDPNSRSLDHRDIEGVIMDNGVEYDSRWMYIADFMNEGAIRLLPESAGINMIQAPTEEQRKKIFDFIYKYNGEVILEINDERLNSVAYMEYNRRTSPSRIFRDIDGYFNDGIVPQQDVRFRMSNENQAIFISNAARAVEGIKQEKATPEQWLKMIEKNGGLKAGEDKWMGLSDWLKASTAKTLTKQEVLDFINENMIIIEEQHYSDAEVAASANKELNDKYPGWEDAFSFEWDSYIDEPYASVWDAEVAVGLYNDYHEDQIELDEDGEFNSMEDEDKVAEFGKEIAEIYYRGNSAVRPINGIRSGYQTRGLSNNREIALTVPSIESWAVDDVIHFGDAGNGRAIAWIRFGETEVTEEGSLMDYEPKNDVERDIKSYIEYAMRNGDDFNTSVGYAYNQITDAPSESVGWTEEAVTAVADGMRGTARTRKILVIDEIQSKRHQEGRERGYRNQARLAEIKARKQEIDEEIKSLALAALDGDRSAKRKESLLYQELGSLRDEAAIIIGRGVPAAPFEKNWHELAMKRMLRYAAENGYDVIAWTTGDQQASRYDLSKMVKKISVYPSKDGSRIVDLHLVDRENDFKNLVVDSEGMVTFGEFKGRALADIVGKDYSMKIMAATRNTEFSGDNLQVGGEGMRGFYDKMLPAFMNKYGKRWGVKVEDIDLPNLGRYGYTMHSVPVTEEMKASVMEGQVMFRVRGENESAEEFVNGVIEDFKSRYTAFNDIVALDPTSKEQLADFIGMPVDKLSDEMMADLMNRIEERDSRAWFNPDTKRIAIFVRENVRDGKKSELVLIHENIHAINKKHNELIAIGEYLWNSAKEGTREYRYKTAITEAYPESEWFDEMSAYVVSEYIQDGEIDVLKGLLDAESTELLDKLLKYNGNGKERARQRPRISWNVLRERPSDKSEESRDEGGEGQSGDLRFRATEITPEVRDEMNVIAATAIVNGNYMKAPNGADTNLTPEQWAMVRTKSFREWFGDWENDPKNASKVVDENGEPKVVFHGGAWRPLLEEKGNAIFKMRGGLMGKGAYFTDMLSTAIDYAREKYGWEHDEEVSDEFLDDNGYITEVFLNIRNEDNIREYYGETYYLATNPSQIKSATGNTGEFADGEGDIRFSIRTKPAPEKTGVGYKVFYLKDGKLYPPMVANQGGVDTPVGVWLDAEEGTRAGESKTGRPQVKQGGKGTQGGSGKLAYRPGWHLGEIPYALQFNRKDESGEKTLFPADFVWAEVEYANDVDYQEEAMSYGYNANGKFQHSLAGLPKLPTDGSYRYRTNPNPETDPWIITGAMKVNRLLTPSEVDQMVIDAGREPQKRQEGAVTDEQIEALNESFDIRYRVNENPTDAQKEAGNYKKGHLNLDGYRITIENPKGSVRRGTDSNGNTWENTLNNDYGYIRGTEGVDGDHIDVYLSDNPSEGNVFVIDQVNPSTREFDEHKVMYGFNSAEEAREAYLANYSEGWNGLGTITEVTKDEFKKWIESSHRKTKPFSEYKSVKAIGAQSEAEEAEDDLLPSTGTPTDEVVASGLDLSPAQTAELAGNIFAALPEESRKKITEGLNGNILGLQDAILQIPARLAMKENWNETDKELASVVREKVQDIVDSKDATSRPLTTKEALWMLHDSDNSPYDLVSAARNAIVARKLGFDPESIRRKKDVDDYIRFRAGGQGMIDAAIDMYNYETSLWTERLKESWFDMNQSVVALQNAMAQASGMAIEPWENIVYALNRLSSKSYADKKKYLRDFLNPLWDAVMDVIKGTDLKVEDVERYMMLKHALERNLVFAKRDAREFYRGMYDEVARKMKSQSHAEQVVALSEAKKALADIDAQIATATGKKLQRLQEERVNAQYKVEVANLVLRGDEKQNENDLQAYYDAIDAELDPKYLEFREKDYGGLTSMYTSYGTVNRSNYKSEEAYQQAVLSMQQPIYDKVADMESAARMEVDDFERRLDTKDLWDKVNAATKETLRHQYESGMLTIEQYEAVRDMFKHYVPLRGFADNTAEDMYSYYMNNSSNGFSMPVIGAKGRKTRAESPLGWIGTMAESAIQADNKNEAKMCLYYAILRRPDQNLLSITDTWFEYSHTENGKKVYKPAYPPKTDRVLNADELRQHMEDWEKDMKSKQVQGKAFKGTQAVNLRGSVIFQEDKQEKEHIIRVKVAGKDYSILINGNPRAAQAINGLLNPDANVDPVREWMGWARRGLSSLLTSFSPLFWVANYQRDLLSSVMRTSEAYGWGEAKRYLANRRKAWRVASYIYKYQDGTLGDSYYENLYKEFAENGGITGYTALTTNKEYEKLLEDYAKEVNNPKAIKWARNAFSNFMSFGEAIEQVSRFAAFITARESGMGIEEAVNAAKEVSVNFNRKGSAQPISREELDKLRTKDGKNLNGAQKIAAIVLSAMPSWLKELYFFFNASVQAITSSVKLAAKNPGKAAGWAGAYFGMSIAMAMLNYLLAGDDDDEYLDLPDYLRHSTLLINVGNGYYIKWSIPQEMRPFYAWADMLVSKMMGKMPHKNLGKEMALAAAQWLPVNPFEGEDPLLGLVPDVASPVVEAAINKTSFGGKIYDDMRFKSEGTVQDIPAYRKATDKTGKVYVELAEILNAISGGDEVQKGWANINPAALEHLVEGYGGGIYDFAKMMITFPGMVLDAVTGEKEMEIKNIPFVNKVVMSVDETNMYSHTNDAFYHYKGIAESAKRIEKEYAESDDPSRAEAYRKEEDWRIYLLYKQYEEDFKDVKERLDNAVDDTETDLLKQEQNVLREMFLNDIAKGEIPEITFEIREDIKRIEKDVKKIMKPADDANKERLEMKKAGDLDGMLRAIERRDSLKDTPEYQRAEEISKEVKAIKKQLNELGSVERRSQRDSVLGELQRNYDKLKERMSTEISELP